MRSWVGTPVELSWSGERIRTRKTKTEKKRYAAYASTNPVYQIQDMSVALTVIAIEVGCLSKTLIDHRFTMSEFGGTEEVMKCLRESKEQKKAIRDEAQRKEALMEKNHREVLTARDEIIVAARRDLGESKEEVQELIPKLRSLEELHQNDLKMTSSLTVEVKELREFKEQAGKEAVRAKRDALLSPITCQHCSKRFDDGVFMCWKANNFEPRLPFYPKPHEVLAYF
ncbi:uncharacterized protein LOC133031402 [Cannabis sativa]|uniref:uncharacterized protein LOC133031402 n=1 Tax=Cannabis sativa TaxID=3483 RepID=UPI0029C9FA9B|nr:uncharacterized protein LOC133031402 [Cannabis sativa]